MYIIYKGVLITPLIINIVLIPAGTMPWGLTLITSRFYYIYYYIGYLLYKQQGLAVAWDRVPR